MCYATFRRYCEIASWSGDREGWRSRRRWFRPHPMAADLKSLVCLVIQIMLRCLLPGSSLMTEKSGTSHLNYKKDPDPASRCNGGDDYRGIANGWITWIDARFKGDIFRANHSNGWIWLMATVAALSLAGHAFSCLIIRTLCLEEICEWRIPTSLSQG